MRRLSISKLNITLLLIAIMATIGTIIVGSHIQQGFDISIGDVSPRTFVATHQVENRVATERLRDEARATVVTIITHDWEVEQRVYEQLFNLFDNINTLRTEKVRSLEVPQIPPLTIAEETETALSEYEDVYVEIDGATPADIGNAIRDSIPPEPMLAMRGPMATHSFFDILEHQRIIASSPALSQLSQEWLEILLTSNQSLYNHFVGSVFYIFSILMEEGVNEYNPDWQQEIYSLFAMRGISYPLNTMGFIILDSYIVPNNLADEVATNNLREERAAEVEPIIFLQNQNIVNEGEIITQETFYALVDLGYVTDGYTINFIPILGITSITFILFGIVVYYVSIFVPASFKNKKYSLLLFTLYMMVVFASFGLRGVPNIFIPMLVFTMLVGMLINYKLALILNLCTTILTFLIIDGDLSYILYFIITGTVSAIITRYALERNKIIVFSLFISLVSAIVAISVSLMLDRTITMDSLFIVGYAFLVGMFSTIICVGTLPLWESFFGVITPLKLLDLTNPNNELLRRLSIEAPGTYHHSIIVANLSEAAAYDIGADTIVARVGAYFHDIGKLRHPHFFIENQVGANPHDEIYPIASAEIIIDHVEYGLELADENKLPLVLRDIIQQHHGTTILSYFHKKELELMEQEGIEEEIEIDLFTYNGPVPQTKEAAIVMLADTVEAAVRSMIGNLKTKDEIAKFVTKLIEDKLMSGQLIDSDLTIKDLDTIQKSFMRVFNGMYHERIPYPKKGERLERRQS